MRSFRGISVLNTSGIVQQRAAHDFDRPMAVVSDRRKRKAAALEAPKVGFFWRLAPSLRNSLITFGRRHVQAALTEGRAHARAHDEEKLQRREEAVQRQLDRVVDKYAEALELFDQWQTQGVKSCTELDNLLEGKSVNDKLAEVRRQIDMRTIGCGWHQFTTKWSFFADEKGHTLELLRRMLFDDILPHEKAQRRLKKLPKEAPPPQLTMRLIKSLGTEDADALRIEGKGLFN